MIAAVKEKAYKFKGKLAFFYNTRIRKIKAYENFICSRPFENLVLGHDGLSVCCYSNRYPSLENLKNTNSLSDVEDFKTLRNEILNSDYSSCSDSCPVYQAGLSKSLYYFRKIKIGYGGINGRENSLEAKTKEFTMSLEDSCNLSCPSCRNEVQGNTVDKELRDLGWKKFYQDLRSLETVSLGGSGEPLMQRDVLFFLNNVSRSMAPNLKTISIITNGHFLTKEFLDGLSSFVKERLELVISLDGASKETIELNRRGIKFERLKENLERVKAFGPKKMIFNMVVQKNNYKEMPAFVEFSKDHGAHSYFIALRNWNTFSKQEYIERNISSLDHPNNSEFREVLFNPIFEDSTTDISSFHFLRM